ncbi:hypothetical protein [Ilumatobacter sp.]|uniref:hypothetical protein n=1 Tax=Ilumatobacter sp. TaxID=1967498 RepID=UPI003AF6A758
MAERAMRPFWIHQLAEYLIGVALIAQGLQEKDPVVPAVAGVLVLLNAAIARGPLGAFKWVGRRLHRWLDLVVMVVILVAALQPWTPVPPGGRLIMLVILVPLGFLWFYTDWAERPGRQQRRADRASIKSEDVGRSAGRMAGNAFKTIKKKSQ